MAVIVLHPVIKSQCCQRQSILGKCLSHKW